MPAIALAAPAPQPPGWPSDICYAEGANKTNPLCGTCSASIVYSTPELGTYIGWLCRWPDGEWRTAEIVRPFGARWTIPAGPGLAALWDANVDAMTSTEVEQRYVTLIAIARPHLANVWRPPVPVVPPPATWMVAAVSTGQRPTYTLQGTTPVRESGKFVPTLTAGKPTSCTCDGAGNSAMLGTVKLCAVNGYKTAAGAARLTTCIPVQP